MRPISKGAAPKVYTDYKDAAPDLIARVGDYCSYCERQIETHLAVEHKQPQLHNGPLINSWSNFLLACVNCNSSKGHGRITLNKFLWPDNDNTLLAIEYISGGFVRPNLTLSSTIQNKALATIKLVGLDKYPGNLNRKPTSADDRWLKRQQTWDLAQRERQMLAQNNTIEMRETIVEVALGRGMFSIWWTIFSGDADMRRRLRLAFAGTHHGCFDANENLLPRAGGQV